MKSLGNIRRAFAPWSDPSAKPFIAFKNVTKRFGHFTAVNDLSLNIYHREFFALLGASGCGKSTLLRMLAGFEQPTSGEIILDGTDLSGTPPYKRPVNMMFQSYALFPHMTVEKNIAFGLKQDGMPKDEMVERVSQMLKLVKLEQFASRKPNQLSGGQRQRVALARSLAKRPKVLLLDEPLGALDKKLREHTQFEIANIQYKTGITFVVVTHDQEEAMTMADRIAVMSHGKVVQVATPAEIYEAPNCRFVADFIGDVNIFDGKVTTASNGAVEIAVDSGFTVRTASSGAPAVGSALGFAIRPEKLRVTRAAPANASINATKGELWDTGYLGDMTVFHVRLPNGNVVKASSLNAQRTVDDPFTYDQEVWVSFDEDSGVLLRD